MAANPYREIENGTPGRIGWRIHYFDAVGSTQRVAAEMAEQGAGQGTVVIAESQSAGRGRLSRSWFSPAGVGLYTTTILRPAISVAEVPRLSLVAGVATAEALETVAPGLVALKWPNDVWLRGLKAGGIIAEAVTDSHQKLGCVLLGIGINVNLATSQLPEELRGKATSVRITTGSPCDRIALASTLFKRLESRYMETITKGFAVIRPLWERYSAITGKRVTIADDAEAITGVVVGIDDDGALVLSTAAGPARILAGDVTVEGAYD